MNLTAATAKAISDAGTETTADAANEGKNERGDNTGNDQPKPPDWSTFI